MVKKRSKRQRPDFLQREVWGGEDRFENDLAFALFLLLREAEKVKKCSQLTTVMRAWFYFFVYKKKAFKNGDSTPLSQRMRVIDKFHKELLVNHSRVSRRSIDYLATANPTSHGIPLTLWYLFRMVGERF